MYLQRYHVGGRHGVFVALPEVESNSDLCNGPSKLAKPNCRVGSFGSRTDAKEGSFDEFSLEAETKFSLVQ